MYVCACQTPGFAVLSSLCALFTHPPHPPAPHSGALTIFLLVSMSSTVAPVPHPPNLLPLQPLPTSFSFWLFMHPGAQSALSHSLSHSLQVSLIFLWSHPYFCIPPWAPALPYSFILCVTATACCLLHCGFFSLLYQPPLPFKPLLLLHIWKHRPQYWLCSQ